MIRFSPELAGIRIHWNNLLENSVCNKFMRGTKNLYYRTKSKIIEQR